MIKLGHTLPIALIVVGIGVAAPIDAEDLAAIYTLAEQQDPQFQQVEASRRAILEVKPQARAQLMLPSITISANVALDPGGKPVGDRPTLDLIASHGFSTTGRRFGQADIDSSAIGLQFNLPIYQGGQVNSRTREAQHRHEEALARLEQERRAAHRQAHDAYLGVITGISRVKALRQAVISNQISIEATQAGFEVGTRTGVDVVNAQREVFRAKRDYAQSRYNYILDTLRLKRAAGMFTPADLTQINTWLSR